MDLFNRFPECKHQLQFISKINDERVDSMEIDINEANGDILSQNNFKFENLQKVVHLRRRCLFLIIILITLIILTSYIIPNLLINLSLKLISTYSIKDKFVLKICYYLNDICISFSYIFSIILYLQYPLNYSFAYILSLIISEYAHALILIVYGRDREKSNNLVAFYRNGSEKPNCQLLKIIVIFFGFWRILKSKGRNKKEINRYKKINSIIFLMSAFITIIIFLDQLFVEKSTIKSCFLGIFWGLFIYTFIFEGICFQFMKANYFINYVNGNFWFLIFVSIIALLIIIFMFNNYNGIEDIFEIYEFIPFYLKSNFNDVAQKNLNRICLIKSLIVSLLIFIVSGIKYNYDFVNSKRNDNNFYNLSDIVLFNQTIKAKLIIGNVAMFIMLGIGLILFMIYINYNSEIPFIYYLLMEIIVFGIFGLGLFGFGIKKMLKPNLDEGRELEDYQDMGFSNSNGSTPGNQNEEERI